MCNLKRKLELIFGEDPFKPGEVWDFLVTQMLGKSLPSFRGRILAGESFQTSVLPN